MGFRADDNTAIDDTNSVDRSYQVCSNRLDKYALVEVPSAVSTIKNKTSFFQPTATENTDRPTNSVPGCKKYRFFCSKKYKNERQQELSAWTSQSHYRRPRAGTVSDCCSRVRQSLRSCGGSAPPHGDVVAKLLVKRVMFAHRPFRELLTDVAPEIVGSHDRGIRRVSTNETDQPRAVQAEPDGAGGGLQQNVEGHGCDLHG